MSAAVEPSDLSAVSTTVSKPVASLDPTKAQQATVVQETQEETRNDSPTTQDQEDTLQKDDVAITINGTTIVLLPEDTLVSMSHWVDDVNEYWELNERNAADHDGTTDDEKKSAREKLTGSLTVMGNGMKNKTVQITHDMAEWFVSMWKHRENESTKSNNSSREHLSTVRETSKSESLKMKFNDFLESLKFAIPAEKEDTATSIVNCGAFSDDDSAAMRANTDIEVMLAESSETGNHEC